MIGNERFISPILSIGGIFMANEENLIPGNQRTLSERRELASKAGKASGKARAEKRDLRKALEKLLEQKYPDKNGNMLTGTEVITLKLFEQAAKGNVKAFETLRATVGQDPVQKVMVAEVEQGVIDEVEELVSGDDQGTGG